MKAYFIKFSDPPGKDTLRVEEESLYEAIILFETTYPDEFIRIVSIKETPSTKGKRFIAVEN